MPKIKRGRAPIRSQAGPKVKTGSQMSMARDKTRERYEANEIARSLPNRDDTLTANSKAIKEQQAGLKRIRSSQATDLNRAK